MQYKHDLGVTVCGNLTWLAYNNSICHNTYGSIHLITHTVSSSSVSQKKKKKIVVRTQLLIAPSSEDHDNKTLNGCNAWLPNTLVLIRSRLNMIPLGIGSNSKML